ncbi:MAG: F0F1 ATP synthase subunit epsilon [Kiritimatiellae bacterium]|nr:F0F1 ATP synthase subunit epsilon [Kiritimatiellia bacterium]
MKLRILTPTDVVLDEEVVHVTAEDVTGSLGVRPGHAALVSALVPGIVVARPPGGRDRYVAINGGVMLVGREGVEIVTRQAVAGGDLSHLEDTVVAGFEKEAREDRVNRAAFEKMRISFMRGVLEFDRAEA